MRRIERRENVARMSREFRVSTFERDTRHSRDILSTHDKSVDSQYDISRECRLSTRSLDAQYDARQISRQSKLTVD
ncbi:hypothetical protein DPMN_146646 [Dreissena polymorpha]|uniref:Uncharacterized protein n=1 Tax=Dreissena polymorpha TaxID=45954 RepID=A0A9D4F8B0_DREPO|nr:hypothetical protein DPMN_146646 [Dreissena polymorpha]